MSALLACMVVVTAVAALAAMAFLTACGTESAADQARAASVGQTVTFGSWEQDGDAANGAEPIKWLVLDKKDGHVLLLAENALATRPYNDAATDVTWESCTLRSWLNGEFYQGAFTDEERGAIRLSDVSNPDNADYGTAGGAPTQDRVFLLSADEAGAYCADEARTCTPSEVVAASSAWVSPDNGCVDWWLRSPGADGAKAADVGTDALVYSNGYPVENADVAVRPALWL